ncbi:extensin-2-like [Amphibalanus amphitrite]|uniref:extensin-2-like n=1 Tax=Amphibalanus amphitrite TaxID=1232801 RepID=UPI001C90D7BF|nr:extensin-2-like [Amphibalanus amphitrite]
MMVLEPEPRPLQSVWPPKDYSRPQPPSFFTRIPEADRTVAWPPRSESDSRSSSSCSGRGDPMQTVALKQELPVNQEQAPVYPTQPVVTVLPRARGDLKWPPEDCQAATPPTPARIPTPKLSRKNQPQGFRGKELPNNYTGYRVAPGVLHMSPDAARYIADRGTQF